MTFRMLTKSKQIKITIAGKEYILSAANKIGGGGQAEIYLIIIDGKEYAYKHFIAGKIDRGTLQKVVLMQKAKAQIPGEMVWPLEIGYTDQGTVDGYVMELLRMHRYQTIFAWVQSVQSNRKWKLSTVIIALLKLHKLMLYLHSIGIVLADVLTWNNVIFDHSGNIKLVDLDSVEMPAAGIRCVAYSPAFLPYNFNVDAMLRGNAFSQETDWFGFTSLVFATVFRLTPFGGVHPKYADDDHFARGRNHMWVFDPSFPVGQVPTQLVASEELLAQFKRTFIDDWRGVFPVEILEDYLAMLVNCANESCQRQYPNDLDKCPFCHHPNDAEIQDEELIQEIETMNDKGPQLLLTVESLILHAASIGSQQQEFIVFSNQAGRTWMHQVTDGKQAAFQLLPKPLPDASEFLQVGTCTAIIQPELPEVVVLQTKTTLVNDKPYYLGVFENCYRNHSGRLLITGSAHRFYFVREDNGKRYLMVGRIFEREVKAASVCEVPDNGDISYIAPLRYDSVVTPIVVVYSSGITKILCLDGDDVYQVQLPKKPTPTSRLVRVIVDSTDGAILLRRIYHGGKEPTVVSSIVDQGGKVIFNAYEALASYPSMDTMQSGLFGKIGTQFVLLHPTPQGVIMEYMESTKRNLLPATKGLVQAHCRYIWYQAELAMVSNTSVYRIPIK